MSSVELSLATFGSAPVTSPSVTDLARDLPGVGHLLSFVNEYDMVTRADRAYLRSVVDLYRSRYGLPSVGAKEMESKYKLELAGLGKPTEQPVDERPEWSLPSSFYHLVGDIVVIQSNLRASDASTPGTPFIRAVHVSSQEFGKLLFCDVGVHKRKTYLERMRNLTLQVPKKPRSFMSDETLCIEGGREGHHSLELANWL